MIIKIKNIDALLLDVRNGNNLYYLAFDYIIKYKLKKAFSFFLP
jgi:hypothetical protein